MNSPSRFGAYEGASEMTLTPDQEHGLRNAVQVIESSYRVLLRNPDMTSQEYYQMRAEQFRTLAKNLEAIANPCSGLLIMAQAYEQLAANAPLDRVVVPFSIPGREGY